jgi:nitrite reductase/ring-hydroxylating ferredoxin subunit
VGFEDELGHIVVLHRTPANHTHLSSYKEFAAGQEVTHKSIITDINDHYLERALIMLNNNQAYQALSNNCEHLSNFVLYGKVASEQVKGALASAGLGYLLLTALDKPAKTKVIGAILLGLGGVLISKSKKLNQTPNTYKR